MTFIYKTNPHFNVPLLVCAIIHWQYCLRFQIAYTTFCKADRKHHISNDCTVIMLLCAIHVFQHLILRNTYSDCCILDNIYKKHLNNFRKRMTDYIEFQKK